MFRVFSCVAVCALPLVMSLPAGAQSYISVTGQAESAQPAPLGPPTVLTQRYVPHTTSPTREMSLLVDSQPLVPSAPTAAITVTSPAPAAARLAANDLGIDRRSIVVSNVRGLNE